MYQLPQGGGVGLGGRGGGGLDTGPHITTPSNANGMQSIVLITLLLLPVIIIISYLSLLLLFIIMLIVFN